MAERAAYRYANSILQLAVEMNQVEIVAEDFCFCTMRLLLGSLHYFYRVRLFSEKKKKISQNFLHQKFQR